MGSGKIYIMWGVMLELEDFFLEGWGFIFWVFEKLFVCIDEVCKLFFFKLEVLYVFDDWIDYLCGGFNCILWIFRKRG